MKKCDCLLLLQQVQDMEDEVASLQAKVARGCCSSTAPLLSTQSLGDIVEEALSRFQTPESEDRSENEAKVYHDHVRAEVAVKHKDPAMYEGKTVKEHTDWIYSCELVFCLKPFTYQKDSCHVLWVMTFLKGKLLEQWKCYEKNHGTDVTSWSSFTSILLDWVQTAANRSLTAGEKYQKAEQRAGQDVRTFAMYLQSIKDLLEPYMEAHQIQHFLSKLRPEVSQGIASLETRPKTLDDMIEAAAWIEENLKAEQKERNAAATPKKGAQTEKPVTPAPASSSQGNQGGRGGRGGSTHGGSRLHGTHSTAGTTPAMQPSNMPATATRQDPSQVTC